MPTRLPATPPTLKTPKRARLRSTRSPCPAPKTSPRRPPMPDLPADTPLEHAARRLSTGPGTGAPDGGHTATLNAIAAVLEQTAPYISEQAEYLTPGGPVQRDLLEQAARVREAAARLRELGPAVTADAAD